RMLRRIHVAAPLRAVLKPLRRAPADAVAGTRNLGPAVGPAATTTVAKTIATAAPSVRIEVSEPPVIRARSLATHLETKGTPGTASRAGRLRPGTPYELATATPVPALLISDMGGTVPPTGTASAAAAAAAAGLPAAKQMQRRKAATARAAVATTPSRRLAASAAAALHLPARAVHVTATRALVAMKYAATATLCAFFPRTCRILGIVALLSGPSLPLLPPLLLPPLPGLRRLRGWLQQPP
ncbi:hypothetical protein Vretifemale_13413, partial [Volvox reticuliferus]